MAGKKDLIRLRKRKRRKQNIIRATIHFFVWAGVAVLYYIGFSVFFDTPVEYELKHSTDRLRREYTALVQRYDTLTTVMRNLSERDRNVFRILFESDPYDFDSEYERKQAATYENIFNRSSRRLKRELRERVAEMETRLDELNDTYLDLQARIDSAGSRCDNIPSIQPVINKQLTLLTASYGMRIHPFYKTLQSHQGVDYTIPEGSRVFATADGTVREVAQRNSTSGQTVVIDHGNGYETSYNHLSKINVRKGQQVRRGDIIALSGDTGLSLAPHLHYEVRYNGMRVDPIHYFFMEAFAHRIPASDAHRPVGHAVVRLTACTETQKTAPSAAFPIFRHDMTHPGSEIKLILLDFDGTLADTRRANTLAYVATLREAGYTLTEEEYAARYFGMRCDEFLTRIGIADPAERERLRLRKIALYPTFFDTVRLNRPLWDFCRQFRAQGGRVWIVSTGSRANIDNAMRHLGIAGPQAVRRLETPDEDTSRKGERLPEENAVDGILSGADVARSKPAPDCFLEAMRREGCTPRETLIFEDSEIGLEAARRSGASYFRVKL